MARADPRKANLCGVDLSGRIIGQVDLSYGDLRWANLMQADLSHANLNYANLSQANLAFSRLKSVKLDHAILTKSILIGSDLSNSVLLNAELSWSGLVGANLFGAVIDGANLDSATFENILVMPPLESIAGAKNLFLVRYFNNPASLTALRKQFKDAGYYDREREITYAINHSEEVQALWYLHFPFSFSSVGTVIEGILKRIFFNAPTQWGMHPSRALLILVSLIAIFAPVYVVVLQRTTSEGIWRQWHEEVVTNRSQRRTWDKRQTTSLADENKTERMQCRWPQAIGYGFYFSVLSAFHIGWRDLNVGTWINRLQPRNYTLYATGWVRTVSGIQSLISVYLLAMWALTYFGRPFE